MSLLVLHCSRFLCRSASTSVSRPASGRCGPHPSVSTTTNQIRSDRSESGRIVGLSPRVTLDVIHVGSVSITWSAGTCGHGTYPPSDQHLWRCGPLGPVMHRTGVDDRPCTRLTPAGGTQIRDVCLSANCTGRGRSASLPVTSSTTPSPAAGANGLPTPPSQPERSISQRFQTRCHLLATRH